MPRAVPRMVASAGEIGGTLFLIVQISYDAVDHILVLDTPEHAAGVTRRLDN